MTVVATAEPLVADAVDFTDGSMVCLFVDPTTAADIAAPDGQPSDTLHVTLAFLPEGVELPEEVAARMFEVAQAFYPLAGEVGGLGMFSAGADGVPIIAIPSVPGMAELRVAVVTVLEDAGVVVADTHGWVPHVTLAYGDGAQVDPGILGTPLQFGELSLVVGAERWDLPFGGVTAAADRYPESQGGHRRGWGLGPAYKLREDQMVGRPGGVGRPFDSSKHPRHPASGKDGRRSPTDGGKFAAKLGMTPFRPDDNPVGFYDSDKFKEFERSLGETAARYDVTIDAKDRVSGFWEGAQEPSLAMDVHDGETGVRAFAQDLRTQWDQDAVLVFQPDRAGEALAYRARATGDIAAALADAGIQGATIYPEGFEVIGDADDAARVIAVADMLGVPHADIKIRAGNLSFAERPG